MATHVISRTGSTTAAVTVAYQVSADDRQGAVSANAADFPGGVFPSGTLTLPAGGAPVNLAIAPNADADVEGDETYKVTLTSTDPAVTFTGGRAVAYGTITNDDVASGALFGPASTADTGFLDMGSADTATFTGTLGNSPFEFFFGCESAAGGAGYVLANANQDHVAGYTQASNGARSGDNNAAYMQTGDVSAGVSFEVTWKRSTKTYTFRIGTMTAVSRSGYTGDGRFVRFKTGAGAQPNIKIVTA